MTVASSLLLTFIGVGLTLSIAPACSTASSGAGEVISCQNPTSAQSTCLSCVNSVCSSAIATYASACPGAVACGNAANCTGPSAACGKYDATDAGAVCSSPNSPVLASFVECVLKSSCITQCQSAGLFQIPQG